jgi:CRP/FNR family cyclic AMP-dependent transcriptional regulator
MDSRLLNYLCSADSGSERVRALSRCAHSILVGQRRLECRVQESPPWCAEPTAEAFCDPELAQVLLQLAQGPLRFVARGKGRIMRQANSMRAPYGPQIVESCVSCPDREDRLFCNLSPAALKRLSEIAGSGRYPKGTILFVEGQPSRGVFILCNGRVKLSTSSADGKTLIVRISEPGELLGLPATISGKPYEVTCEVIEPTKANFISRTDFLNFLRDHGDVALRVAQELSDTYQSAFAEMRTIGLSHSAGEKLARFVLDWTASHNTDKDTIKTKLSFTHEEIAQMIGASRETVTRLLADFRKKQLLQVKGSALIVKNKSALEKVVGGS